jgi:hypothetical protein
VRTGGLVDGSPPPLSPKRDLTAGFLLRKKSVAPLASHLDGKKDERTRFVAVLEIPPVESAETAVRVQIVKDFKHSR